MRRLFLVMVVMLAAVASSFGVNDNITFKIDPTAEGFKSSTVKCHGGRIRVFFNGTEVEFNLGTGEYVSGAVPDFSEGLKEFYFYYSIYSNKTTTTVGEKVNNVVLGTAGEAVAMPSASSFDCNGKWVELKIDMSDMAKAGLLDAMFNPPLSELSGGISPMPKPEPEPVVYAEGGKIDCSGSTDRIYDANGVDVTSQNGSLPSGVYIVDCEGVKKKVVMK